MPSIMSVSTRQIFVDLAVKIAKTHLADSRSRRRWSSIVSRIVRRTPERVKVPRHAHVHFRTYDERTNRRSSVRTHARTCVDFLALGVGIGGPRLVSRSPVPPLPSRGSTTSADRMGRALSRPAAPKSLGRATRSHRLLRRATLFRACPWWPLLLRATLTEVLRVRNR